MYDTWKDNRISKFKKLITQHTKTGAIFTFYNSYQKEINGFNYKAEYTILNIEPDLQNKKYFTHKKYYLPKVIF